MIFFNDAENKHVLLLRVYILPLKAQKAVTAYFSSKQLLCFAYAGNICVTCDTLWWPV